MKSRNDDGLRRSVITPLFPAFGLAPGCLNGLNPKSKFLAFIQISSWVDGEL